MRSCRHRQVALISTLSFSLHSSLHPQAGRPIRLHLHHPERTTALRHPQEQRQEGAGGGVRPRRPHRGGENLTTRSLSCARGGQSLFDPSPLPSRGKHRANCLDGGDPIWASSRPVRANQIPASIIKDLLHQSTPTKKSSGSHRPALTPPPYLVTFKSREQLTQLRQS